MLALTMIIFSCGENVITEPLEYDGTPYVFEHKGLPNPELPLDNALSIEGVKLGRMLFYEESLSKNNLISCANCHLQKDGFSDLNQFSKGTDGFLGKRHAMPVFNMAWHNNGFFWDGRAPKLRDQALKPIQDKLEMNESLPNVISKLSKLEKYKDQFTRAFVNGKIDELNISLALEQFMFSIVSNESKYDRFLKNQVQLSPEEERGRKMFFAEFDPTGKIKGAECFHCHGGPNFTNDEYMNNGLDNEANMKDIGRSMVTMSESDKGKFHTPSLRNIEYTPPYMHDGRIKTLEEVVDHYNFGVESSPTVDVLLQYNLQPGGLGLTIQDQLDLIAFLKTLSDPNFLVNPNFSKLK